MSAGAHAAPATRTQTAGGAARTALLRTGAFAVGLAATFGAAGVLGAPALDSFAAVQDVEQVPSHTSAAQERVAHKVQALSQEHHCSPDGLAPGVIPEHAVIRVGDAVRLTTFDRGWASYQGEKPGALIAVCAR